MARETKIGLLVGLAFIVLFGIILSGRDATQVTDPAYGPAGSGDIHKVIGRESKAEDGADPFSPWGSSSRTEGVAPETGIVAFGGHVRAATGVPRLPAMRDAAQGTVVAVQPGDTARNEKSLLEPPAQTYVIKRNDSLIRIARRVYGPDGGKHWQAIYHANRDKISDPRRLKIGQAIVIPTLASSGADGSEDGSPAITLTVSDLAKVARNQNDLQEQPLVVGRTYTVQPNDTFYGIAARLYGDSSKARLLILKNQHLVSNPRRLRVGQKILLLDEVRLARATVAGGLRP